MVVLVGIDGALRAARATPAGGRSDQFASALLVIVVVTGAGGLGLLVGGARPREFLHFVYAVVVAATVPIASSLARAASPRVQGTATVLGAVVALVVIARLFATG